MSVIRTQYGVVSASTTVVNATSGAIDLPRPADAAENNTIDWTVRPAFRKEFESGRCVVKAGADFGVAGMLLTKVEIIALNPGTSLAPLNLSFAQFPDNSILTQPGFANPPVLRTLLDLSASPSTSPFTLAIDATTKAFANSLTSDLLSSILLRADEFVRITLYNGTGGDVTGTLEARYDFGMNAGN